MFKPPSLQNEYTLISALDPALSLPTDKEQRAFALQTARETGNWSPLIAEGKEPTTFTMKPLTGSQFNWWAGEVKRQGFVEAEAQALAVRLALRDIGNFGPHKVEHFIVDGYSLAKTETIDAIYSAPSGRDVVLELAAIVVERARTAPSPKS
jgi:hypothetical protein